MAAQRRALRWAQGSICAGCGQPVPSAKRLALYHPDYPTFDHVVTRSEGGRRVLENGLLKHQRCNHARANRAANGCDLVWLSLVRDRLAERPRSFKPIFKGGRRNVC
ncbi:MAG: HNH endonuclease [Tsuneonella sp.]